MKRILKWITLVLCILIAIPTLAILSVWGYYKSIVWTTPALRTDVRPGDLGSQVNPFAGTGGYFYLCGHDTPAATLPFGMIRLAPDTASILINKTGLNKAGYFYGDNKLLGFSHTRLVGGDTLEGNVFRILPTVESRAEKLRKKDQRYVRFSHADETAFPGYYAVRLPKDDILAELTATTRVGVHRYTFKKNEAPHLLMDITSVPGDRKCEDAVVTILPEAHELEGKVKTFGSFSGRYGGLDVYFVARFSEPFAKYGTWNGDRFVAGKDGDAQVGARDVGVDLAFEKKAAEQVVEVRLAISYVNVVNARKNLEAEAAGKSFDDIYAAARDAWEKDLSTIRIEGGSKTQRRIFYTALFHALEMPTIFNDVNGEYIGLDRAIHKAEGFQYYTDFSMWDTFRTVHPLFNIILRGDERDMMVSLVEMAKAGGCLPRWPSGCGYTNCMFGTPADVAVSEAYLKGIHDFDIETAYKCMRETGLTGKPASSQFAGRDGLDQYLKFGYCPADINESVAKTIEYGHSDFAIAQLAEALGKKDDAATFAEHSKFYKNLWNPATRYFESKDEQGNFPKERKPLMLTYADFKHRYTRGYVEGSAEQWRFPAPYDAEGLIGLFGGPEAFVKELNNFFAKASPDVAAWNPGPYYWQGNEPDLDAAYMFNPAGRPDLTQKWVRWILDTKYSDDYVGIPGNDDGGALSAWYVFSALGFYPVQGSTKYQLGAPLFAKAEVKIGDKLLTIIADNYAPKNIYVQHVTLNDKPLDRTWFTHDEIAQGGTLRFEMGPAPAVGRH